MDAGSFPVIHLYGTGDAAAPAPGAAPAGPALQSVLEDGQPVRLRSLRGLGGHLPLRAMLVLDTSGSIRPALDQIKVAASGFLARLSDLDAVGLIQFSSAVHVLAAPTVQRARLREGLASLRAEGGTALYDAVKAGLEQVLRAGSAGPAADVGPRVGAVVLLTDGRDEDIPGQPGSVTRLEPLKALLRQSGVPIYALGLGRDVDRDVLNQIADASLGQAYFADDPGGVEALFERVFARLRGTQGVAYLSPNLAPDGTRRRLTLNSEDGSSAQTEYTAPLHPHLVWRYVPDAPSGAMGAADPGSACLAGALAPRGELAVLGDPPMLLRGGAVAASAPPLAWNVERAALLDDGSAWLMGAEASQRYRLDGTTLQPAPLLLPDELAGSFWQVAALSPRGQFELLFNSGAAGKGALLAAVERGQSPRLAWRVPCPGASCDRLAGAAISDSGVALVNQTGSLFRLDAQGRAGPARREVFYGSVALSADGVSAAAVVWLPAPVRAVLLDDTLRPLEARPVQTGPESLPPVVALSPNARFLAVLDDLRVSAHDRQRPGWQTVALDNPPPAGRCERTLRIDDTGRILFDDGGGLTLHRGFAGAWK